jgi:hypothetical protein
MTTNRIPMNVQFAMNSELNHCYRTLEYLQSALARAIEEGDLMIEDHCFKNIDFITDRIVELDNLLNRK